MSFCHLQGGVGAVALAPSSKKARSDAATIALKGRWRPAIGIVRMINIIVSLRQYFLLRDMPQDRIWLDQRQDRIWLNQGWREALQQGRAEEEVPSASEEDPGEVEGPSSTPTPEFFQVDTLR